MAASSASAAHHRIVALEVLKGQTRAEEARDILTRVAKQVGFCDRVCGCFRGDVVWWDDGDNLWFGGSCDAVVCVMDVYAG
jgi:hypothetical protein